MTARTEKPRDGALPGLRRLLLALVLFGMLGLLMELLLLEHYDSAWQWAPIVLLATGLVAGTVLWVRPGPRTVRTFRWLMAAFVAAALLGMALHYLGNAEFELEMDSSTRGLALVWAALRGATPALAPGALAQLGLLGLVLAYRHPALGAPRGEGGAGS